ncbi:MAG: universal stress protein [Ilumatobacteraceae bacterium]
MTARWIVGIDGSPVAVDAMHWAALHAGDRQAELVAVSAFQVPTVLALLTAKRGFGVDELGLAATAAHDIDMAIEQVGGDVAPGTVTVQPRVEEGPAAHVLVDLATEADLLVLGRNGSGELRNHPVGSVTRYCATHATAPVVVVPDGWTAARSELIVVGFDGSPNSADAVAWALEFADAAATVRIVSAIDVAPWLDENLTRERFPDEIAAEEARLGELLDVLDPERRAERVVVLHSPRQALAEAAGTADLIVVGTRGHGGIAAGLMGSVSTWILHGTHAPVVVVPKRRAS